MRIRLEKCLETWSREAGYDYRADRPVLDLDIIKSPGIHQRLRQYGFTREAAIAAASFYGNVVEQGFAFAHDLRVLCWYWPNGEEIIFPVNTQGTVYIGNGPEFWFDFYPFLRRCGEAAAIYQCSLGQYSLARQDKPGKGAHPLYIGGQTHFGHFIVDKLAPLLSLTAIAQDISFRSFIVPPGHAGVTRELLDILWKALQGHGFDRGHYIHKSCQKIELPKKNGLYLVGPAWVPADNHRPDSLKIANQYLYDNSDLFCALSSEPKGPASRPSVAYISRFSANAIQHDRIANYQDITGFLEANHVDHLCPTRMSLKERISLLSAYDVLISDSGSCCLNALMFSRPDAKIFQFQSKRLLSDYSDLPASQHYKSLPLIGKRLFSIPGAPAQESTANSWYDKVYFDASTIAEALAGR